MRVHDANGPKFELRSSAVKADASSALTEYDQIPDVVIWRVADRSATTCLLHASRATKHNRQNSARFQPTCSLSMSTAVCVQLRRP